MKYIIPHNKAHKRMFNSMTNYLYSKCELCKVERLYVALSTQSTSKKALCKNYVPNVFKKAIKKPIHF